MILFHYTNKVFIRGIELAGFLPVGVILEDVVGFGTAVKIERNGKNVFRIKIHELKYICRLNLPLYNRSNCK